jgi:hypothetical protein
MQIDESGAVEAGEHETELVLVTGRRIETGELFWPEDDSLYLLASTWEAVDPLDDDSDSISCMVVPPKRGRQSVAHEAMQELIQLSFTTQPGDMLWRAVGFLGASDVFQGALPRVARFLGQQEALGARFGLVLLYQVTRIAGDLVKDDLLRCDLAGCAMAADIPFSALP